MENENNMFIKLGPIGCTNGKVEWDEKGRTEIVEMFITYSQSILHSIQFRYYEDENLVLSHVFGNSLYAPKCDVVKLDYPAEYITCVKGLYITNDVISIEITTNFGTYGPYGETSITSARMKYFHDDVEEYSFYVGEGRIFGGFHGCRTPNGSDKGIGVYMMLSTTLEVETRYVYN